MKLIGLGKAVEIRSVIKTKLSRVTRFIETH